MNIPKILTEKADETEAKLKEIYPELAPFFKKCFLIFSKTVDFVEHLLLPKPTNILGCIKSFLAIYNGKQVKCSTI